MSLDSARVRAIFLEAVEKHVADTWDQFVEEACTGDAELRREVAILLDAHRQAGSFLAGGVVARGGRVDGPSVSEVPGTMIGPYKLLEQIGEGGFGVVFMAEQQEPIHRKVALKVIKPGMDTKEVIARFEAERQALAILDHPNIAKVLGAGQTSAGRPYFVMDLVKGLPITEYCNQAQLPPRQRLELFVHLCQAVQHAHQKGIIHRDLKPSNVLVTLNDGAPLVKVIDFGIAKALGQRLTEKTLFTGFAQLIGSPLYMSPEQAAFSNIDVDTRTDVYSLGVLLYELLTGTTPFDEERLHRVDYQEMRRIIREEEPPKPSTRISTLGKAATTISIQRRSDPKQLHHCVRGELDWIVMKALEKERQRRYESASAFAADVERYLHDEPVQACPPSAGYRFWKFARRNKVALLTAGLVALALIAGMAVSAWQAIRATRAEIKAKQDAAIAEAVNEFLNEGLLAQAGPTKTPDRDLKLRTVLDRASQRIEGRFGDQPLVEARLRDTLAMTYESIGEYGVAEAHARRALELYQGVRGVEHPETLSALDRLARILSCQGQNDEGRKLFEKVVSRRRRVLGPEHPDTLRSIYHLACVLRSQEQLVEAYKLHNETLEIQRRVLGPEHPDTLSSMSGLGAVLLQQERFEEARRLFEQTLPLRRRVLGSEHPDTLGSMHYLAYVLMRQGHFAEALRLDEETLDIQRRVLGAAHPDTVVSINNLAWLLATAPANQIRAPDRAVALATELAKLRPDNANSWNTLGVAQYRAGNWKEAVSALENSVNLDPGTAYGFFFLAMAHWQLGEVKNTTAPDRARHRQEARKQFDRAVTWMEKNQPKHEELIRFRAEAAELLGIKEQAPTAPMK